jgi:hypothetical protein
LPAILPFSQLCRIRRRRFPTCCPILESIDSICVVGDGLKWFNGLYLAVTQAIEARVNAGGSVDGAWLAGPDVRFAQLYFGAVQSALTGAWRLDCWKAVFSVHDHVQIATIQFALAGMNAHINHDLCLAIDTTRKATNIAPLHGTAQYSDYTSLNLTLDGLIDKAKQNLNLRLPGDPLPAVSHLEDLTASRDIDAAREKAWKNAENLWNLAPPFAAGLTDTMDGFTAVPAVPLRNR